jgi:hypothetical protein
VDENDLPPGENLPEARGRFSATAAGRPPRGARQHRVKRVFVYDADVRIRVFPELLFKFFRRQDAGVSPADDHYFFHVGPRMRALLIHRTLFE